MNNLTPLRSLVLAVGAAAALAATGALAGEASWIFLRGTFTHDPMSGARVAQYVRTPPVEPLDDERVVTSSYRRTRTNLRGANGSNDTYYQVQQWGGGRGGIDAEWERFHDAWKESYLSGGSYYQGAYGYPGAYGAGGYGGNHGPAYGYPPGPGGPGFAPGWNGGP